MAATEPVDRQVHADLADTAERRKYQFIRPRHQLAPTDATAPKYTSPAVIGTRAPDDVRTIMQPCSSRVSKVPSMVAPPDLMETACPRPAARDSHNFRISPNPRPLSQMPRNSAHPSESAANSSSAPIWMPSAASEVAGVGVPSGAATSRTTLVRARPRARATSLPRWSSRWNRKPRAGNPLTERGDRA